MTGTPMLYETPEEREARIARLVDEARERNFRDTMLYGTASRAVANALAMMREAPPLAPHMEVTGNATGYLADGRRIQVIVSVYPRQEEEPRARASEG